MPDRATRGKLAALVSEGPHAKAAAALLTAGRIPEALEFLLEKGDVRGAGRISLRLNQPQRAADLFERVSDFEAAANACVKIPDLRRAAETFVRAGMHERASELFVQIGDLWGAAEALQNAGRWRQAAAIHAQSHNEILASKCLGLALRSEGRPAEAAAELLVAGEYVPAAECLAEVGRFAEAADAYRKSGHLDRVAAMLEKAGRPGEAARVSEEAGDLATAARLYQAANDTERAIAVLVQAEDHLAAGYLAFKSKQPERAEAILRQCLPTDRGFARANFLLGTVLDQSGRRPEALRHFAVYVERTVPTRKNANVFEQLAGTFEQSGLHDVALKCLRKLAAERLLSDGLAPVLHRLEQESTRVDAEVPSAGPRKPAADGGKDLDGLPPVLANRYEVARRIATGGTAVVYRAWDAMLKRDVVLKFLSNPCLPDDLALEYFLREAQVLASIAHPNIVQVYDVGICRGRHYMVMEFLEGETLEQALAQAAPRGLPVPTVARMAQDVAEALNYAHNRKILHRDVKPGNIMLQPDGRSKLMDFGMAKALEVHTSRSMYICGTPDYMSPEQEVGFDLTTASDIYSFGLVLLEALMGPLPSRPTAQAARGARLEVLATSGLREPVRRILTECLSLDVERRPPSAMAVAEVLVRFGAR